MAQIAQQPDSGDYALVVGESLIDVVDGSRYAGGSPMNVAVGLARLGRPAHLATWFGRDKDGALLANHLAQSHVEVVPGSDGANHTSTAQVRFDEAGSASYVFDLEWRLPASFVNDVTAPAPVVAHTGSIAAALQPGVTDVLTVIEGLAGLTAVSFDVNVRPNIIGPLAEVLPFAERFASLADIVKASDEDLAWLYPGVPPLVSARRWASEGTALVVLTKGAEGVTAITGSDEIDVPAPTVQVVDTVGAGDAFMAGLLHALWGAGLLGPGARDALRSMDETALRQALSVATQVAAITLSRPGANPPWAAELR
ncbi:MAG: carbohydrate kinase [Propionibacteriaceae bacterium]|nr:carbohydrate kinase [Propionibacteriaceae bacterium]